MAELQLPTGLTPISAQERSEFLDVLRGFALFGVATANMTIYSLYLYVPGPVRAGWKTHSPDRALKFLELLLIEGKFYTIFSVLFGIGFSILLGRASAKGLAVHRFFLRRFFFLFLIGVLHAIFLWHDDILQAYAFSGALLLPFILTRTRTIITIAIMALLAPIMIKLGGGIPVGLLTDAQNALFGQFGFTENTVLDTWTKGRPEEIVGLNLIQWLSHLSFLITSGMIFQIFGCFLLGFCIGRSEIHRKLELYRPLMKQIAFAGFAVGIPLNACYAATFFSDGWVKVLTGTFGVLPLSAAYASLLGLIWLNPNGRKRIRCFAPVGRMALTNYIGQSVICTLIFYGTGLGLGGTMGPTMYLPIAGGVYGLQVMTSQWWLERFRFGPLEWLWRMLTYGTFFPLRKRAEA